MSTGPFRKTGILQKTLFAALVLLFLLHNDFWLWTDSSRFLGLPSGLAYHIAYCLAAMVLMTLLVKHAWPQTLTAKGGD